VTIQKPVSWQSIAISVGVMVVVLVLGGAITQLGPWYQGLKKPFWQPPGPAFGIIWTTIYVLTTTCAVLTWRTISNAKDGAKLIGLFGANCVLNLMWSYLFFALERPDWSLYQVGIFWLSILALIIYIWPRQKLASILLLPYLIWVSIASFLNLAIVQLNGPFA
jgi:translocator protein